ncbi:MAG: PLP-dependent aminotransferase family protein [Deltaproteobacteria bacterium]|nr:PLP-dependent aminotransferase family protein [Deltaproteobacteria bacterium]
MWKLPEDAKSGWPGKAADQQDGGAAGVRGGARLPRYKQLIRLVEDLLEKGRLASGQRLPPERELAARLGLNRSTVIRALDELAERGVLIRKKGSGTYVNPEKWGLQSHELFNWQSPPALRLQKLGSGWSAFARQAAALREKARRGQRRLLDLSGDSLPEDLLPDLYLAYRSELGASPGTASGGLSLRELVRAEHGAEQDEEMALLGLGSFRGTVRNFLRETAGLDLPPEQILITSGTQQALFLVTQCLLQPGDAVGVEFPSYFYSLPVFQAAGLRLYALPMDEAGITLDGLDARHQTRKLKMIFLNPVFHNPTGSCMSPARRREVLQYCSLRHIPIFEDDAYSLLAFDPGLDTAPIKAADKHNQVIYCGSLSSYAGRNLRAGWMAAPEPVIRRLAEVRLHMDAGLSVLPQLMAARYLESGFVPHRLRLWENLAARAHGLVRLLRDKWGGRLEFQEPKGGMYLYARPLEAAAGRAGKGGRGGKAAGFGDTLLAELMHEGIIPAPGLDFGDSGAAVRFNFAHFNAQYSAFLAGWRGRA